MKFGYRRVSSIDQSLARQELPKNCDRVFEEKISGKNVERTQLKILLDLIHPGDEIVVHSIDSGYVLDDGEIPQNITGGITDRAASGLG